MSKDNTITLGELFTTEQISHILSVYNKNGGDTSKCARELKPYFARISDQLQSKGLLPDYAAYAIPFWISKHAAEVQLMVDQNEGLRRVLGDHWQN